MITVQPCEIPISSALLAVQEKGAFADCYTIELAGTVSQAEFIEAFYTTALFKVERKLLSWFAGKRATNNDAARLANGTAKSFSAWTVEISSDDQLLLADFTGRTKSWLMVMQLRNSHQQAVTKLYFGSAVMAKHSTSPGAPRMGIAFHALSGFHKLYSKLLLQAAHTKLLANQNIRQRDPVTPN